MRHLLTARGEVTTCESCDKPDWFVCEGTEKQRPCPGLSFGPWERAVIQLWKRCKVRGALPYAGGVLDQPETLMKAFDVIDYEVASHREAQARANSQALKHKGRRK